MNEATDMPLAPSQPLVAKNVKIGITEGDPCIFIVFFDDQDAPMALARCGEELVDIIVKDMQKFRKARQSQ